MNLQILDEAIDDLAEGFLFYEDQEPGIGEYFLQSLQSDIESLRVYAGIHQVVFGYHRCLSKRFPFVIYYDLKRDSVRVHAVIDGRQNPASIRRRLKR